MGKPETATLTLSAERRASGLELEVRDDGRGIDWERLAEVARGKGLAATTHDELVAALFADGVSTRSEVTDVSGRGVGMAALLAEVRRLGGSISVESQRQSGTCFRVSVPAFFEAPRLRAA